jgi:acyl carrier protein
MIRLPRRCPLVGERDASARSKDIPMADTRLEVVRFALALHLSVDPDRIEPEHRLKADLGLDPLDLVLVVLRLEEVEEAEFPVADLETVTTVADLVAVVRGWSSLGRETPPPPSRQPALRHSSGMQTIKAIPAAAVVRWGRAASALALTVAKP